MCMRMHILYYYFLRINLLFFMYRWIYYNNDQHRDALKIHYIVIVNKYRVLFGSHTLKVNYVFRFHMDTNLVTCRRSKYL